jgi:hypothetical protein
MPIAHIEPSGSIEIRLRELRQLFHTLDPAPFRDQDLDEAAASYLVEACREAGPRSPLRLVVHLPADEASSVAASGLADAIHNYFAQRARQARADMHSMLRVGAISFVIGLAFLIACLGLRQWLLAMSAPGGNAVVGEGLLILGWVAMWRPTEALLYDWWPLARRRTLLRFLAGIPVEIRSTP